MNIYFGKLYAGAIVVNSDFGISRKQKDNSKFSVLEFRRINRKFANLGLLLNCEFRNYYEFKLE